MVETYVYMYKITYFNDIDNTQHTNAGIVAATDEQRVFDILHEQYGDCFVSCFVEAVDAYGPVEFDVSHYDIIKQWILEGPGGM